MQFLMAVTMALAVIPAKHKPQQVDRPLKVRIFGEQQLVGEHRPLDEMVAQLRASGFPIIHQDISDDNFPESPSDFGPRRIAIAEFDHGLGLSDALKAMKAQGFRPATVRDLVEYALRARLDYRAHRVIALGSLLRLEHNAAVGGADTYAPYLGEYGAWCQLDLGWTGNGWNKQWYFLVERIDY